MRAAIFGTKIIITIMACSILAACEFDTGSDNNKPVVPSETGGLSGDGGNTAGETAGGLTGGTTGDTTGGPIGGTTGDTTDGLTGGTTGDTTGGLTGGTTGETTGELTGGTTGETTGELTGGTTGETTGELTGGTTGETTGELTGGTTGDTTGGLTGGTTGDTTGGLTGGTTGDTTGGLTGGTTGDTTGGASINFRYVPSVQITESTTDRWQSYFALQMEAALAPLNALDGLLEETIDVNYDTCGTANAFYSLLTRSIVICDELVAMTIASYPGNYDNAISAVNFILYHEIAHALVDILNIPTTGNPESTADSLAAVFSGKTGRAFGSVTGALFLSTDTVSYGDEHIGGEDRAGDIICWAVGSDGSLLFNNTLSPFVAPLIQANRNCIAEYEALETSVQTLLPPIADLATSEIVTPSRIAPMDPNPPRIEGELPTTEIGITSLTNGADFWFCTRTDNANVAYSFGADGSGRYAFRNASDEVVGIPFTYELLSENSVALLYQNQDGSTLQETVTGIAFASRDSFAGTSDTDGPLQCQRESSNTETAVAVSWGSSPVSEYMRNSSAY